MLIFLFIKILILFSAIALIAFGFFGAGLISLLKYLAVALGASVIFTIIYPYVRGVKKGDKILVNGEIAIGFNGISLDDGRIGNVIKVELFNREIVFCEVTSYEGLFSYAKAKFLASEKLKVK